MYIVFSSILLLVAGLVMAKWVTPKVNSETANYVCVIFQVVAIVLGALFLVFSLGAIIDANVGSELEYQNMYYEREMLEYRVEQLEQDLTGNELIYSDIVDFNNDLRRIKRNATSPWFDWFTNQKLATIDYVEIPGFTPSEVHTP